MFWSLATYTCNKKISCQEYTDCSAQGTGPEVDVSSSQFTKTGTPSWSGWCLLKTSFERQMEHHCDVVVTALQGSVTSLVTARASPFRVKMLEAESEPKALV